uniref:Uncharacterized protein n=1 Tax=Heterorhabditis bacteriophora TaxID=37862 RepID=A0A1I7W9U3_HETBA
MYVDRRNYTISTLLGYHFVLVTESLFLCEGISLPLNSKHFVMFNQLSSLTNSYFGWQLLNSSYSSDEFDNNKDREMENSSWRRIGTDPALPSQFPMTYTTGL